MTQPYISLSSETINTKNIIADTSCKTEVDSLTKKLVYTTADILPTNEGGKATLMKKLEGGISSDIDIPNNFDGSIIVAFIVDIDGSIKGERIVKDETSKIGPQLLNIVKTFKWTPAKCHNKNVAMLYKLRIVVDPTEH